MESEFKTINEWEQELNIKILDPDGFDRTDRDLYSKRFTRKDFERRAMHCTCMVGMSNLRQF